MVSKLIVVLFISLGLGLTQACSRDNEDNGIREIFGPDSKVELVFFFKKNTSHESRKNFFENILNQPHPGGGYWPRDGIKATFGVDRNGYEGFGFTFLDDATEKQRKEIKQLLQESPLVHKVYENIAPNEINDL